MSGQPHSWRCACTYCDISPCVAGNDKTKCLACNDTMPKDLSRGLTGYIQSTKQYVKDKKPATVKGLMLKGARTGRSDQLRPSISRRRSALRAHVCSGRCSEHGRQARCSPRARAQRHAHLQLCG